MKVTLVTDLRNNQFARAHSLYVAAAAAGHDVRFVGCAAGPLWLPLRDSPDTAGRCHVAAEDSALLDILEDTDVAVAVKPLPHTLGRCLRVLEGRRVPLLVDIDDPDIEVCTWWARPGRALTAAYMAAHAARTSRLLRLAAAARALPTSVSNPILHERYGGLIVPHAREDSGPGDVAPSRETITVSFVGTVRKHKGIEMLRAAVVNLAPVGFELVVTAPPPGDVKPWETWTGAVPMARAVELVKAADVVALPSENRGYGKAQLPIKLVDAMLAGRALAVSDAGPLAWGTGGTAEVFRAGSVPSLTTALAALTSSSIRAARGAAARAFALRTYTPEAVAPALDAALRSAMAAQRSSPR